MHVQSCTSDSMRGLEVQVLTKIFLFQITIRMSYQNDTHVSQRYYVPWEIETLINVLAIRNSSL